MHIFVLAWSTTSTAIYCNTLQQIAANCNNLLAYRWRSTHACVYVTHPLPSLCMRVNHTVAYCNALQHTATHCNTLQHTATHCNTLHQLACVLALEHACVRVGYKTVTLALYAHALEQSLFDISRISHIVLLLDLAVYRLLRNSDFWEILTFEKFYLLVPLRFLQVNFLKRHVNSKSSM